MSFDLFEFFASLINFCLCLFVYKQVTHPLSNLIRVTSSNFSCTFCRNGLDQVSESQCWWLSCEDGQEQQPSLYPPGAKGIPLLSLPSHHTDYQSFAVSFEIRKWVQLYISQLKAGMCRPRFTAAKKQNQPKCLLIAK